MKIRVKNLRIICFFYLPFIMYSFCYSLIKMTTFGTVFNISSAASMLMNLSIILILIKIATDKLTVNKIFICFALISVGLLCDRYSNRNDFLVIILFLLAGCEGIEIRKFIKCSCIMQVIILFVTVIASLLGILPDWTYSSTAKGISHSHGFVYPNILSCLLFYMILSYFYLKENIRMRDIVLFELVNLYLYYVTKGRTAFLFLLIMLPFFLLFNKYNSSQSITRVGKFNRLIRMSLMILPAGCLIFSLVSSYAYIAGNSWAYLLNSFLNNRVRMSAKAISEYGIHLFGTEVSWVGNGGRGYILASYAVYNFVDNSYMYILITFGVVATFLVIVLYTLAMKWLFEAGNYKMCFIMALIVLYSVIEPRLIEIYFNPFVLIAALQLYERKEALRNLFGSKMRANQIVKN